MEQLSIEKKQWRSYFNSFNKRNHSRLACLEISDETGSHQTIKEMPLSGISVDKSGVEIMLENRRFDESSHYTHIVKMPKNIIKDLSQNGLDEILVIVDESGKKTKLTFENLPKLNA